MSMPDTSEIARSALERAVALLGVLDREHSHAELYTNLRGVRHELATAQAALRTPFPDSGSGDANGHAIVLEMPHWAASRAHATRPGSLRHLVLADLGEALVGYTDHDLAAEIARPLRMARMLRWELTRAGWVQPWVCPAGLSFPGVTESGGVWRLASGPAGRPCRLWGITAAGRKALRRLTSGQMVLPWEVDGDAPQGSEDSATEDAAVPEG